MRKRLRAVMLLVLAVLSSGEWACADTGRFAISPQISTLGIGAELITKITSNVNARFGYHGASLDFDGKESDIKYDFEADLSSFSALLDWHAFGNSFRISGGVLINDSNVDLKAKPATSLTIGDTTYTSADVGSLTGTIGFEGTAPYVGIGWGNAFASNRKWGLLFDLGVVFTGAPDVSLSANGSKASNTIFQANLRREKQDLKDELDKYKFYPVISLGLFFRF